MATPANRGGLAAGAAPLGAGPAAAHEAARPSQSIRLNSKLAPQDLEELVRAARDQIHAAMPRQFEYRGRTYWLRYRISVALIDVFDGVAEGVPIVRAACGSEQVYGVTPPGEEGA